MHTQSFFVWGTSIRHSRQTRKRHELHSAPRFMYPNTSRHRAHDDFDSIIGLSNEPPFTLMAPFRRNNCKSARNVLVTCILCVCFFYILVQWAIDNSAFQIRKKENRTNGRVEADRKWKMGGMRKRERKKRKKKDLFWIIS